MARSFHSHVSTPLLIDPLVIDMVFNRLSLPDFGRASKIVPTPVSRFPTDLESRQAASALWDADKLLKILYVEVKDPREKIFWKTSVSELTTLNTIFCNRKPSVSDISNFRSLGGNLKSRSQCQDQAHMWQTSSSQETWALFAELDACSLGWLTRKHVVNHFLSSLLFSSASIYKKMQFERQHTVYISNVVLSQLGFVPVFSFFSQPCCKTWMNAFQDIKLVALSKCDPALDIIALSKCNAALRKDFDSKQIWADVGILDGSTRKHVVYPFVSQLRTFPAIINVTSKSRIKYDHYAVPIVSESGCCFVPMFSSKSVCKTWSVILQLPHVKLDTLSKCRHLACILRTESYPRQSWAHELDAISFGWFTLKDFVNPFLLPVLFSTALTAIASNKLRIDYGWQLSVPIANMAVPGLCFVPVSYVSSLTCCRSTWTKVVPLQHFKLATLFKRRLQVRMLRSESYPQQAWAYEGVLDASILGWPRAKHVLSTSVASSVCFFAVITVASNKLMFEYDQHSVVPIIANANLAVPGFCLVPVSSVSCLSFCKTLMNVVPLQDVKCAVLTQSQTPACMLQSESYPQKAWALFTELDASVLGWPRRKHALSTIVASSVFSPASTIASRKLRFEYSNQCSVPIANVALSRLCFGHVSSVSFLPFFKMDDFHLQDFKLGTLFKCRLQVRMLRSESYPQQAWAFEGVLDASILGRPRAKHVLSTFVAFSVCFPAQITVASNKLRFEYGQHSVVPIIANAHVALPGLCFVPVSSVSCLSFCKTLMNVVPLQHVKLAALFDGQRQTYVILDSSGWFMRKDLVYRFVSLCFFPESVAFATSKLRFKHDQHCADLPSVSPKGLCKTWVGSVQLSNFKLVILPQHQAPTSRSGFHLVGDWCSDVRCTSWKTGGPLCTAPARLWEGHPEVFKRLKKMRSRPQQPKCHDRCILRIFHQRTCFDHGKWMKMKRDPLFLLSRSPSKAQVMAVLVLDF